MLLPGDDGFAQTALAIFVYAVLPTLHEVLGVALFGKTLGKRLVGIDVRRVDGSQVGWSKSLVRFVIPFAGFNLFIVGGLLVWLSILFDSGRWQGWHDQAASTVVTRK